MQELEALIRSVPGECCITAHLLLKDFGKLDEFYVSLFLLLFLQMAKSLSQKKEAGNQAFRVGKLQLAYDTYTEALAIDPLNVFTNSKLYCNRATVLLKVMLHQICSVKRHG